MNIKSFFIISTSQNLLQGEKNRMRIIPIGNAPSSGSTFLGDLLDSSPISACGPELGLFSIQQTYKDYKYFKKKIFSRCFTSSIYLGYTRFIKDDLHKFGLNSEELIFIMDMFDNYSDFFSYFTESYLSLRGKQIDGFLFEKTPQNISYIKEYFNKFDGYYINIVRNPIDVYKSLLKRGFPYGVAVLTWFLEQAKVIPFINNSRLIIVKYEELVEDPYKTVATIMKKISKKEMKCEIIKERYEKNNYRKFHTKRIKSWTIRDVGKIKMSTHVKEINEKDKELLGSLLYLKISPEYAKLIGIPEYSFRDLLEIFGYSDLFYKIIKNKKEKKKFILDKPSKVFLLKKTLYSFVASKKFFNFLKLVTT